MACPGVPEFTHRLAKVRRPAPVQSTHTRPYHTRFTAFGWAGICGWGADDETKLHQLLGVMQQKRGRHRFPR
jgi:hypothetical protein